MFISSDSSKEFSNLPAYLRGSFDQGVGKYFRFGLTTNSNYNVTKGSNIDLYSVLNNTPLANPYNEDGSLKRTVKLNSQDENFVVTRDVVENLEDSWLNEKKGFGTKPKRLKKIITKTLWPKFRSNPIGPRAPMA